MNQEAVRWMCRNAMPFTNYTIMAWLNKFILPRWGAVVFDGVKYVWKPNQ